MQSPSCLLAASLLADRMRKAGLYRDNTKVVPVICQFAVDGAQHFFELASPTNGMPNMLNSEPVLHVNIFKSGNLGVS